MKVRDRQTDRQTNRQRQRKTYVKTYYTHTFITDMMRHNRPDLYSMYVLCMYVLCMYAQQRDIQTDSHIQRDLEIIRQNGSEEKKKRIRNIQYIA